MSRPVAPLGEAHIAYLTSQYPATSHTFISREVAAMRSIGIEIDTFSIRPPSSEELQDEVIREEANTTFAVLCQPVGAFLAAHTATFFSDPIGYLATFGLALRHRPPGIRGLALSLAHFAEAILLARELRRRRVNHLHNHFANSAATVGYLATRILRMPWSFTMHGISETDYPAGLMLGRKIEAATLVACVSYFGRAQAMRLVPPSQWNKLHVVRCGLPLDSLRARGGGHRSKQIACVGRLSPEKGQAGLLDAFALVASEIPGLRLVFVGDGPESEELRSMAERLGLNECVTFVGRLGEIETISEIARSQVLVLPSFMEGLPIVLIEAMALGTPVIASRVAGIPELVRDGENGLLFTPSDWTELAGHIRSLAEDDSLRKRLAAGGLERVAVEFESRRSAERLVQLFRGEYPS